VRSLGQGSRSAGENGVAFGAHQLKDVRLSPLSKIADAMGVKLLDLLA